MKVLVLCHGNVNRSPACAAVIASLGHEVRSRGLKPGKYEKRASSKMRAAMASLGYSLDAHVPTPVLREDLLEWADLTLYMDGGNLRRLTKLLEEWDPDDDLFGENCCLAEFSDGTHKRIPDPAFYKRTSREFTQTVDLIVRCSKNFAERMKER